MQCAGGWRAAAGPAQFCRATAGPSDFGSGPALCGQCHECACRALFCSPRAAQSDCGGQRQHVCGGAARQPECAAPLRRRRLAAGAGATRLAHRAGGALGAAGPADSPHLRRAQRSRYRRLGMADPRPPAAQAGAAAVCGVWHLFGAEHLARAAAAQRDFGDHQREFAGRHGGRRHRGGPLPCPCGPPRGVSAGACCCALCC